jgi:hypothetical protein
MFYIILFFVLFVSFILLIIMAAKAPSTFWKNFGHNLKAFYLYVALFVGLIITIVNGITLTKTFLEQTVFPVEYDYVSYYECDGSDSYGFDRPKPVDTEDEDALTEDEKAACEERVKERARDDHQNQVNRDYAGGTAGLLFGLLIWITHFVWIRKTK